jgi:Cu/Ag efflux protein CusF
MNRLILTCAAIALTATLASCGQKQETTTTYASPPAATEANTASNMAGMASTGAAQTGESTGVVKAVDAAGGKVTLDHQPIPAIGWPAMSMTFTADPSILGGVKAGDKVKFSVRIADGKNEVTAIGKP